MEKSVVYKYIEDVPFGSKLIYHVVVMDRPDRSLCNFRKLSTGEIKYLLDLPPRPDMCPDCKIAKEMIDK